MRIVAGKYGGRKLTVPRNKAIRPTSDKIRGAVFNMLESRGAVENACVLDGFCGTGALGLEALSRGAKTCTFIDKSRTSLDLARRNAQDLGADNAHFEVQDMTKLRRNEGDQAALIFLDPPYEKNLVIPALGALSSAGWLVDGAVIVVEVERQFKEAFSPEFGVLNERTYGDTKIFLLQYTAINQD